MQAKHFMPLEGNNVQKQLMQGATCVGVELLHCSSAVSESQPVLFRKGEVQTVVGTVLCKQPSSAVSPATLSVTWQRSRCFKALLMSLSPCVSATVKAGAS